MRRSFNNIFAALALTGATLTGAMTMDAGTAYADNVGISLNIGDVAIGYTDGYWDHDHHWHKWRSTKYRSAYRHAEGAEYHATLHTRMANAGWHERDDHHDDHR